MEFLDKNTIKIMNENDTLGNLLCHYLLQEEETEFCSYQRSHFLEEESSFLLKIITKTMQPKELLKKVIHKIEKEIINLEKSFK